MLLTDYNNSRPHTQSCKTLWRDLLWLCAHPHTKNWFTRVFYCFISHWSPKSSLTGLILSDSSSKRRVFTQATVISGYGPESLRLDSFWGPQLSHLTHQLHMHCCLCSCVHRLRRAPALRGGAGAVREPSLTWIAAVRARLVAGSGQHVLQQQLVPLRFQRHGAFLSVQMGGKACPRTSADRQEGRRGRPADHLSPPIWAGPVNGSRRQTRTGPNWMIPADKSVSLFRCNGSITKSGWVHSNQADRLPPPPPPCQPPSLLRCCVGEVRHLAA